MALGTGPFPRARLPASHWRAIDQASAILVDWTLDGLDRLAIDGSIEESSIHDFLPMLASNDFTPSVVRHLLVSLVSMGLKQRLTESWPLQCTAEEIALVATIDLATVLLAEQSESAHFADWFTHVCLHPDIVLLFAAYEEHALRPGLRRDAWFTPFAVGGALHPYLDSERTGV